MSILTLSGNEIVTISGRSGVAVGYITPAATFTATAASSASGGTKTTLTSAGAHGLTAAVAVGKHLNITAGTGWTAGLYNISSIDLDTTGVAVTIDVAYSAGFGSPTISLAGTAATFVAVTIPPLGPNSHIEIDGTWNIAASTNNKTLIVKLGSTSFYQPAISTAGAIYYRPSTIIIQNTGATNSQVGGLSVSSAPQTTTSGVAIATGSVDTSVSTSLTFGGLSATANEFVYISRYIVKVFR